MYWPLAISDYYISTSREQRNIALQCARLYVVDFHKFWTILLIFIWFCYSFQQEIMQLKAFLIGILILMHFLQRPICYLLFALKCWGWKKRKYLQNFLWIRKHPSYSKQFWNSKNTSVTQILDISIFQQHDLKLLGLELCGKEMIGMISAE